MLFEKLKEKKVKYKNFEFNIVTNVVKSIPIRIELHYKTQYDDKLYRIILVLSLYSKIHLIQITSHGDFFGSGGLFNKISF